MTACSAYNANGGICFNGFIQKRFCWAGASGCKSCGHVSDAALPHCLKDELPDHWVTDDGHPIFKKPSRTDAENAAGMVS